MATDKTLITHTQRSCKMFSMISITFYFAALIQITNGFRDGAIEDYIVNGGASNVKLRLSPSGVFSNVNASPGDILLSFPSSLIMTIDGDIKSFQNLKPVMENIDAKKYLRDPYVLLSIQWLLQKQLGSKSKFAPLISNSFRYKIKNSLIWSESELNELKGTHAYDLTQDRKMFVNETFVNLEYFLVQEYKVFSDDEFTKDDFFWALSYVWSHSRLTTTPENISLPVIIPIASDMNINTAKYSSEDLSSRSSPISLELSDNGMLNIVARSNIAKNEEIVVNIQLGNSILLVHHGLVIPNNEFDEVPVHIALSEEDVFFDIKKRMLYLIGLEASNLFGVRVSGGLPSLAVSALRIQALQWNEIDQWDESKVDSMVTVRNELIVSRAIITIANTLLSQYTTTIEDDYSMLSDIDDSNQKLHQALIIRSSEKLVLLEAKKSVKAKWLDLLLEKEL